MDANQLRRAFTQFFVERGHVAVPSSGLIPHHPRAPLFTNAGMNQFLPYFLGEETPPYRRATSVQKCVRVRGKHDDIDLIGTDNTHLSFFEMLGNFSFGDYFKEEAIAYAWELSTEVFGMDGDRIWVTCHIDDDDAAAIWRDQIGLPPYRIQRMGEDNFWEMGDTGPCGPCSEIYYDLGPDYGDEGGPAEGSDSRYIEFWNLVFTQYDRQADGSLADLPRKNIDTGAGFERIIPILQRKDSMWDTDVLRPIIGASEQVTRRRYGADERADVSLRVLADHARTMTFLINDGVFPSNEDRGYVLRRVIRRAVRHAFHLGVETVVTPDLVRATVKVMGEAYPELERNLDFITGVVEREELRFRQTLRSGLAMLEAEVATNAAAATASASLPGAIASGAGDGKMISGELAFRLHDTYGFPFEITREIARDLGAEVDHAGYEMAMAEQRRRAREARKAETGDALIGQYRELVEEFGPTHFTGYSEYESSARVLAVLGPDEHGQVEIFLDRTPFYAEGGGQVGDTGTIATPTGTARVLDTTFALPGLHRHTAHLVQGQLSPGQEAVAAVDVERREAIRRNHTGTHLLHWALREVLGPHVKQAGSLVAPDRLRFDFSHYEALTPAELGQVERMANERVLANEPVRTYETSMQEAQRLGAIAFFGDKYGEVVRIVEAGDRSLELCGGTHVSALGMIGPIKIVSEGSIGSNLRRIEALTGAGALEHIRNEEAILEQAAAALRVRPEELPGRLERELDARKALEEELKALRRQLAGGEARELAGEAESGIVVARRDGPAPGELRELALAVRDRPGVRAVVLGGVPERGGVSLVAAVTKESGLKASELLVEAARLVGGGGGKQPDVAVAGGKDASRLDEALERARLAAGLVAA